MVWAMTDSLDDALAVIRAAVLLSCDLMKVALWYFADPIDVFDDALRQPAAVLNSRMPWAHWLGFGSGRLSSAPMVRSRCTFANTSYRFDASEVTIGVSQVSTACAGSSPRRYSCPPTAPTRPRRVVQG